MPLVAGAGTILVAAIFAVASHFQGEFLKQISEVLHPSVVYRNELGRKISVSIATVLLIAAFAVVIWLRYQVIADQLGLNADFKERSASSSSSLILVKSRAEIGLNLFVWGLGVLWAFWASEKVPRLRETFRELMQANKKLEKARRPFSADQKRIQAQYERERANNDVAIREYSSLSEEVRGAIKRLED